MLIWQLSNSKFLYVGLDSVKDLLFDGCKSIKEIFTFLNFHMHAQEASSLIETVQGHSGAICFFKSSIPEDLLEKKNLCQSKKYLCIKVYSDNLHFQELPSRKTIKISYPELDLDNENGLLGVQMNRIAKMVNEVDNAFLIVNPIQDDSFLPTFLKLDQLFWLLRDLEKVNLVAIENLCISDPESWEVDEGSEPNQFLMTMVAIVTTRKAS